ncbi:MAG: hypothetical protein RIG77_03425 [Cyclobacteriaceae bacterium]
MKNKRFSAFILAAFSSLIVHAIVMAQSDPAFLPSIEKINPIPTQMNYQNSFEVNNEGGHLQGVQFLHANGHDYYVVSGSSSSYSYYSIIKAGKENGVISINKILDKPFKHAGGFQIHKNLMAIGIEDNNTKDKSKVLVWRLEDPEKPPKEPIITIERAGAPKRATAGSVGIVETNGVLLVVVGDWDSEHLDFYSANIVGKTPYKAELKCSLDTKLIDKSQWTDENWMSYQNINIIKDKSNQLYLAGMTTSKTKEDIIDLYELHSDNQSAYQLKKVYTKKFPGNNTTKFRWGSGVCALPDGKLTILSCTENIQGSSVIHLYK